MLTHSLYNTAVPLESMAFLLVDDILLLYGTKEIMDYTVALSCFLFVTYHCKIIHEVFEILSCLSVM